MGHFFIGLIALASLGWLGSFILPWWGIALIAAIIGFALQMHGVLSFLCGILATGGLYFVHLNMINTANEGLLVSKIAVIFNIGSPSLLFWISLLIGALLGGLGMLTGKYGRDAILGPKETGRRRYRTSGR
ncbi:MAG: hypothetical protein GY810_06335 [Aureispira sp.]|nr:hypothetical protein [Aureispira sp.]